MSATSDNLQRLRDAGFPIDQVPEAQRQAVAELSREEVETLIRIQQRIASSSEVQGYRAPSDTNGYVVF